MYSSTPSLNSTLYGVGGQHYTPADLPLEVSVPIVQEARWAPGLFWMGAENVGPHQDSI